MRVTIHRGTHQIGGCLTEIEHERYKVFIDFGTPLPGSGGGKLFPIEGLTTGDVSRSALFISHYHGDHIGNVCEVSNELPVFIGKTAYQIYESLEKRLSHIPDLEQAEVHRSIARHMQSFRTFTPLDTLEIGTISVTPLMVDHSAIDAYMFLIQAGGTRLLHTGDFRLHGFRGRALPNVIRRYAQNIDYVITEGTNINRPKAANLDEHTLQKYFKEEFRKHKYNFVVISTTNIDRIFAIYHAASESNRHFICDNYQKKIIQLISNSPEWTSPLYRTPTRIYTPGKTSDKKMFFSERLTRLLNRDGFCMLVRAGDMFKEFMNRYDDSNESAVYYSMYRGYLDKGHLSYNRQLEQFLSHRNPIYMHTSGHCDIKSLDKVLNLIKPKRGIIPIHTEYPEKFTEIFGKIAPIILLDDKETLNCTVHD